MSPELKQQKSGIDLKSQIFGLGIKHQRSAMALISPYNRQTSKLYETLHRYQELKKQIEDKFSPNKYLQSIDSQNGVMPRISKYQQLVKMQHQDDSLVVMSRVSTSNKVDGDQFG